MIVLHEEMEAGIEEVAPPLWMEVRVEVVCVESVALVHCYLLNPCLGHDWI